ncbi:MAG: xanthine dehydrogenase family protein molybdopterin-binding subunit [Acidimicrobiales bacterium]|nr:xanthine dehydrogenase family protein molybdopterin-binding subunit [Acidimicrobiales bacterium]
MTRREDPRFLRGGATFTADVDDLRLDGAAHLVFVRSPVAHGALCGVDATAARAHPGVLGVFDAADLGLGLMPPVLPHFDPRLGVPPLATDRVRYVGEPVAVVAAIDLATAQDAADEVIVDIDPLPPVVGHAAASADSVVVHPDVDGPGSNTVATSAVGDEGPGLLDGCDLVIRATMTHQRTAACPLEVRAAASVWTGDGRLHHWMSVQAPHAARLTLATVFGVEPAAVHVVAPDVGGGFGAKFGCSPEDVVTAWVARRLGRAARWTETRSESMLGLPHGRAQHHEIELGGTRDGRLTAYRLDVVADAGAYASLGVYVPDATLRMTTGVYDLARARASARVVTTTTTPVSAYRGSGRPEATCAIERAVDLFAHEVGLDPLELRRRNLVSAEDFPYTTAVGTTYDSGDYRRVLDLAADAVGYDECRAEQRRRRNGHDRRALGIGTAVYVESTAAGPGMEFATVAVGDDGRVTVRSGSSPHGQGHDTTWAMLAADELGVAMADVTVVCGDTDAVAAGLGTFASRSVQLAGSAVKQASEALVEHGRRLAAERFEAAHTDVVFDEGAFHIAGVPASVVGWAELAASVPERELVGDAMFTGGMTFPFGAHVSVVEVDLDTGSTTVLRHVAVDDAGVLINPLLCEGQVHGGIAQGIAEALFEEFRYDADGNPLGASLASYAVVSAAELPPFEVHHTVTPAPNNPLGAKGIGESGTIGAVAAVQNAVCDAIAHLGVRHVDLPCTPERVWAALRAAEQAAAERRSGGQE